MTVAALAEMMVTADTPYLLPIVVHVSPLTTVYVVTQVNTGTAVSLMDGALVIVAVGLIDGALVVGLKDGMMDETAVVEAGIQST